MASETYETLNVPAPAAEEATSNRKWKNIVAQSGSVAVLGALTYAGFEVDKNDYPSMAVAREAFESFKHPILGYGGAMAARLLDRRNNTSSRQQWTAMAVGATATNFVAETGQEFTHNTDEIGSFYELRNWFESCKDYAVALGGMAWYGFLARQQRQQ